MSEPVTFTALHRHFKAHSDSDQTAAICVFMLAAGALLRERNESLAIKIINKIELNMIAIDASLNTIVDGVIGEFA